MERSSSQSVKNRRESAEVCNDGPLFFRGLLFALPLSLLLWVLLVAVNGRCGVVVNVSPRPFSPASYHGRMGRMLAAVAAGMFMVAAVCVAPANAADDCQSAPILGLNPPQVRTICDTAINSDGSWMRIREFWYLQGPGVKGPLIDSDIYTVTSDTIPPGEPGHLG